MRCCDELIPASEAADIAVDYLAGEYRFVEPSRLEIGVAQVEYEDCVWSVRLQVAIDDDSVLLMSTHLVQVDACTGRVVGHTLEDHAVVHR